MRRDHELELAAMRGRCELCEAQLADLTAALEEHLARIDDEYELFDNPDLVVLGNPDHDESEAGGLMSDEVLEVKYVHREDPEGIARRHKFRPGVAMIALPGRRAVLMVGTRSTIWGDY